MANERRIRQDFVAGQLSAGMLAGDTLMQSASLADLAAVPATHMAALALFRTDNAGRVIQKEIVYVTAHTAGATSATVTRGREGTTAQVWNAGDRWSLTSLASDQTVLCTSGTRPATPYSGMRIYETDTWREYVWMDTQWIRARLYDDDSGWQTPTLLNGWVNYDTNAYQAARYRKIGDEVYITGLVRSGTLGTAVFNLPVGYRPLRNLHFATLCSTGGAAQLAVLEIKGTNGSPAGDVHANIAGQTWYSLECSFMIGP